jgi:hypothetical protein
VVLLATIGVAAALGRGVHTADLASRAEPYRQRLLRALDREDPSAKQRAEELQLLDRRFAAHPDATLLHILPGGLFLILAPFQFSARVRKRHIQFHRWSGRLLVAVGTIAALTGLYFGLLMPYGGLGESAAIALFGGLFLAALGKALVAIWRRDPARHREWMIRAFAIALGISTVRVVGAALDLTLTPLGLSPKAAFVLSVWTGWALTLGAAELWIARTRPVTHALGAPVAVAWRTGISNL